MVKILVEESKKPGNFPQISPEAGEFPVANLPGDVYVPRDCTVVDFDETDFTTIGSWAINGLDLTGIVPVGATAVRLRMRIWGTATHYFTLRRDATNVENVFDSGQLRVTGYAHDLQGEIKLNSDRLIDYYNTSATLVDLYLYVLGWYI